MAVFTHPSQILNLVDLVDWKFRVYMMAVIMPRIEVYMAASALSLVPVKGIFTVHIILKIVKRLFRGQLQKICSVIQRRSVFWRTFLRFAPVQLSPFRSVRCDFLMKAMPAVRRVRQIRFCETNPHIAIESKKGVGTTVTMTLPFKIGEPVEKEKNVNYEEIPVEGLRALLAEDNELNMEIAKFMLEDYGIHVECAADGEEAVQKFKNLSWDITM